MSQRKKALSRRSFLTRVVGAAAMTGSAGAITGCGTTGAYTGITDQDGGFYADRAGHGRGTVRTGITDSDEGRNRDAVGAGRGGAGRNTYGRQRTGVTDADSGRGADAPGYGRRRTTRGPSGITDIDPRDRTGNGQGGRPGSCTDSDNNSGGYRADPAGRGRHC